MRHSLRALRVALCVAALLGCSEARQMQPSTLPPGPATSPASMTQSMSPSATSNVPATQTPPAAPGGGQSAPPKEPPASPPSTPPAPAQPMMGTMGMTGTGGVGAPMGDTGAKASDTPGAMDTPAACDKDVVKMGSEVAIIGESFIALTGAIPRLLTAHAREAMTIGPTESYRSYAVSGTQLTTGAIPGQYRQAKQAGPVKVVLMDGAGNDLLIGGRCRSGIDASCMEIISTVDTLFKEMKADGVVDVVYFFYPDPMGIGAGIKTAMDMLRPAMQKFCEENKDVRCIWVDQRESWEGKYAMFTSDGIHPTEAGSQASADQIWKAMVDNCVAQ